MHLELPYSGQVECLVAQTTRAYCPLHITQIEQKLVSHIYMILLFLASFSYIRRKKALKCSNAGSVRRRNRKIGKEEVYENEQNDYKSMKSLKNG